MDPVALGVTVALSPLAVYAGAKFHGRQVRLRREAAGFSTVDFRGFNPPEVAAIWARDRKLFWSAFLVMTFTGIVLWAATLRANGLPLPVPWALFFVVLWAFVAAFVVAGAEWAFSLRKHGGLPAGWSRSLAWALVALVVCAAQFVAVRTL